ncbi:hypothetical protein ACOMHN_047504 [Nucella lapillus]
MQKIKYKTFHVYLEDGSADSIRAELTGPDSSPPVDFTWSGTTATCSFTPVETGHHKLDVLCAENSITGSPVRFRVLADRSQVFYHSPPHACVGIGADMKVDVSAAGQADVQMEARSPSGHSRNISALYRTGAYDASFTPTEVGTWYISVLYDGEPIQGSPFPLSVFDPSFVRVSGLDGGAVGQSLDFSVDATEVGEGEVGVTVNHAGSEVPSSVRSEGFGRYSADFTPSRPGVYTVYVTLNDMQVKDSPFSVEVVDSSQVTLSGEGLSLVPLHTTPHHTTPHHTAPHHTTLHHTTPTFSLSVPDSPFSVEVVDSSQCGGGGLHPGDAQWGRPQPGSPPHLTTPHHTAPHHTTPTFPLSVPDSPFSVEVVDSTQVTLSGEGLSLIPLHQPANFTIHTKGAGNGKVDIDIAGKHIIGVQYNDQTVEGSPFSCEAYGPGTVRVSDVPPCCLLSQPVTFYLDASDAGSGNIEILRFKASFLPDSVDTHTIVVTFNDRQVQGSPWPVEAVDMRVTGRGEVSVGVATWATVTGSGRVGDHLTVALTGPNGRSLPFDRETNMDGDVEVTYTPTLVGDHLVSVQCSGQEVADSPFLAKAFDIHAITVTTLTDVFVGQPVDFTINVQAAGEGQLQIMVDGGEIPNDVEQEDVGVYRISFIPVSPGLQTVEILFNDLALPASPLTCNALAMDGEVSGMSDLVAVDTETAFTVKSAAAANAEVIVLAKFKQRKVSSCID